MAMLVPAIGIIVLAMLVGFLFMRKPVGNARSLVITLINAIVFIIIVYLILLLFGVVSL